MPSGRSSRHRLLYAITAVALGAILLNIGAYLVMERERLDIVRREEGLTELWSGTTRLTSGIEGQRTAISDYLLTRELSAITRYRADLQLETEAAAALQEQAIDVPAFVAYLAVATQANADWRGAFAQPAMMAVARGDESALQALTAQATTLHEPVSRALAAMSSALRDRRAELRTQQESLAVTRNVSTGLQMGMGVLVTLGAVWLIQRFLRGLQRNAEHSDVLNRFTESTSFASDDHAVAVANLQALELLVAPDAAVTHVLNRSKDRAVPEASSGAARTELLALGALSHCPGVQRGAIYVTDDASLPLSVHCPVYPVDRGTLACVPLNSGESVGAVHLYWERPGALPLGQRPNVTRLTDHAALAIGNRRLMAALQGQASTDARTGLANSRAFDQACEDELRGVGPDRPVGVLMLDLDHFKDFNDRYGHPAGDEALRAFAGVLRSCVREQDLAARYGGEEFAVLLPGLDTDLTLAVAERIRSRTESTVIALGPGITDRVTVSIGVAVAPRQASDAVTLVRLADEALYRAKAAGRNRVSHLPEDDTPTAPTLAAVAS